MSVWLHKKFAPNNPKTKPVTVNLRSQREVSETWFHGLRSWTAKGNRKKCKFKTFGGFLFLLVGWKFCYFSSLSINWSVDDCV